MVIFSTSCVKTAWRLAPACCLLLAAACGGAGSSTTAQPGAASAPAASTPQSTAAPAPAVNACALVTKAEVDAAVGRSLLDPKTTNSAGMSSCEFADPKLPIAKIVTLTVVVGTNPADVKDAMDLAKSNAAAGAVQVIADLGDAAYWDNVLHALTVNKGRYQLEVFVDPDAGLKAARAVMAKALTRLPA